MVAAPPVAQQISPQQERCSMLLSPFVDQEGKQLRYSAEALASDIEKGTDEQREAALKYALCSGNIEVLQRLVLPVIKFCPLSRSKLLKKLALLFWEVVPKTDAQGQLLPQMLLVCQGLLSNLQSPNEFVRGSTLRLLCKLSERDIVQHLVPAIVENLRHSHSYVRKNALLCVMAVVVERGWSDMIPDAVEQVEEVLQSEQNVSARRNALLFLLKADPARAVAALEQMLGQIAQQGAPLQLVALDLMRQICQGQEAAAARAHYAPHVAKLLNAVSPVVALEAASTLLRMSALESAVKAAVQTLARLLRDVSIGTDAAVRLVVVRRLAELKHRCRRPLQENVVDVARSVATSGDAASMMETLSLVEELCCRSNLSDVVSFLRAQLNDSYFSSDLNSEMLQYRAALVETSRRIAVQYPAHAEDLLNVAMRAAASSNTPATEARELLCMARQLAFSHETLRDAVLQQVLQVLPQLRHASVIRVALWILGEFGGHSVESANECIKCLQSATGDLPLVEISSDKTVATAVSEKPRVRTVVRADGTYAQEVVSQQETSQEMEMTALRKAMCSIGLDKQADRLRGSFVGSVLVSALVKLLLRLNSLGSCNNAASAWTMALCASLLRLHAPSQDLSKCGGSVKRIKQCLSLLLALGDPTQAQKVAKYAAIFRSCRTAFATLEEEERADRMADESEEESDRGESLERPMRLRLLAGGGAWTSAVEEDEEGGGQEGDLETSAASLSERLQRVHQLSGNSDAVYAETAVSVRGQDVILDVLLINRTDETLQRAGVALFCSPDLRVVQQAPRVVLPRNGAARVQVNLKLTAAGAAVVFGDIIFERTKASAAGRQMRIGVAPLHLDVADFVQPAHCSNARFSDMWQAFEWENKVDVRTNLTVLPAFLRRLASITGTRCLTRNLQGNADFLNANLYGRTVFGDDALLNVSVERRADGSLAGSVRIRAKTRGVAMLLGDKVTSRQKVEHPAVYEQSHAAKHV